MFYGAEIWALTRKSMEVLRASYDRMLRYMVGIKWQDGTSSSEVANRCGPGSSAQKGKSPMVWICKQSRGGYNVGSSGDFGGRKKEIS